MSNMREIQMRMKSIKETLKIIKAMKLVSAAKMKRARQQLDITLPYFNKIETTLADILMHSGKISNKYFDKRSEKKARKKAYLIMTGDKGLAGSYNNNIIKLAEETIAGKDDYVLYVAGNVGRSYFIRKNYNVAADFNFPVQDPTIYRSRDISDRILEAFTNQEIDEVYLVYTKMLSSIKLEPKVLKLLPLELDSLLEDIKRSGNINTEPDDSQNINYRLMYEPSKQAVFDVLIPKYVKGLVYGALVEAFASEQSARMTAMDNATTNAEEMLQKLNIYYNRARQAAITQEISEVVGGAEATGQQSI